MTQYIDKAAVIEKIDELYSSLREHPGTCGTNYILGFHQMGYIIIDFCNSLKVKEVDLDKEIDEWCSKCINDYELEGWVGIAIQNVAKHFFELGLKAQKGE